MEAVKLAKLAATPLADDALDRMVKVTNEGFTAGRLTKTELLSWMVLYFENHSFEKCIEKIREAHFDQVAYLESVVREMKGARKSGASSRDLVTLLAPLTGTKMSQVSKRKSAISDAELQQQDKMGIDTE